ncbi:hypothetical protein QE152_g35854 [Popillia japonica]|uniref:Uncharacterized protein n=1 Tax=Popillia japonica TaxID=7064 RepID=A0AAW1IEU8_POPJA
MDCDHANGHRGEYKMSDILLMKEKNGNICYQLRFPNSISKGDFLEATGNPYLLVPCLSPASDLSTSS